MEKFFLFSSLVQLISFNKLLNKEVNQNILICTRVKKEVIQFFWRIMIINYLLNSIASKESPVFSLQPYFFRQPK